MSIWQTTVTVRLDRPINDTTAQTIAGEVADSEPRWTRVMANLGDDGHRLRIVIADDTVASPAETIGSITSRLQEVVIEHGRKVDSWEAGEAYNEEELDRRLATASMPTLMSGADFAELLGVSRQRVNELEHERRRAVAEGRQHPFPTPLVPGWWIAVTARRYAQTRRGPGRPPKQDGA